MARFRIGEAAAMLGVSADTARRWVDSGRLAATRDAQGHRTVAGHDLAAFARALASANEERSGESPATPRSSAGRSPAPKSSARNRFRGIVTAITRDSVMAQVEIQAGPFRVVSLMSREAVDDLDLRVGSLACAVVKSTNVIVERP